MTPWCEEAAPLTHAEQLSVSFAPWKEHDRVSSSSFPRAAHLPCAAAGHSAAPEEPHQKRTALRTALTTAVPRVKYMTPLLSPFHAAAGWGLERHWPAAC